MTNNKGGRPPLPEEARTIRRAVYLLSSQWDTLKRLGEGNANEGIRMLLAKQPPAKPKRSR